MVDQTHEDTIECTQDSPFGRMAMAMAIGTSFLFLLNCLVFLDTWDWLSLIHI